MTHTNGHQDPAFGSYKDPNKMFEAAIKRGWPIVLLINGRETRLGG